ncbi:MAG: rod shape-determining protein RodA [Bacteroidota bacterium]
MKTQFDFFSRLDKPTIFIYLLLVVIGWINIYAAEYNENYTSILNFSQSYGKQFIWIVTAIVLAIIVLTIDAKFFFAFAYVLFGVSIILLIGVLFFGTEINASKSWFQIGGIAIQPAESTKFTTALAMARIIYDNRSRTRNMRALIKPLTIMLLPISLIFLQNETGTTLVFFAFIIVLYREGYLPGIILILGIISAGLFILTLIFNEYYVMAFISITGIITGILMRKKQGAIRQIILILIVMNAYVFFVSYVYDEVLQPHQKNRIAVLIDETVDTRGAGYNLHQSKIAIGSGGLWGKGFLEGTQTKFNFVPEQSTDFIFCTVGEEWGFLGSFVLISLFLSLLVRLTMLAERQKSSFSRIFGYSLVSVLFFHFMINIGMTIGLMPVIGIPLPFISYGGSSLWSFTIFLFTFLKLDSKRLELM